jgi:peptide/nickel transport system permease protein
MPRLFFRRLLLLAPLLLAATFLTQGLLLASPGNYFDTLAANAQLSPAVRERLKTQFGLDSNDPFTRYGKWAAQAMRGNFGYSFRYQMPVQNLIGERVAHTLLLTVTALVLAWGLAIPLGVWLAQHDSNWKTHLFNSGAALALAAPPVLLALGGLWLAARTGWFPVGGARDALRWDEFNALQKCADLLWHLCLPALVLATSQWAQYVRQVRAAMRETLFADYVRTARAKGLSETRVLYRHALRNALNPLATLFGFSLAYLLAGAVLVEQVFAWPGLGRLTVEALLAQDEPVVLASVALLTVMLVAGNFIADALLARFDPRIRWERQ